MKPVPAQIKCCLGLVVLTLCTFLISCGQSNRYPIISSLDTEKNWAVPSASCVVVCVASDADGDNLTYTWSATGGTFSGAGPVVTWVAPDRPGTHTIIVKVVDGKGGEASAQLSIDVLVNHTPVIESLTADPPVVNQAETSTLKCVASDPDGDEISYLWTASRGNISGQGSTVTWTAPMTCAEYTIKVTITDDKGGEASQELTVRVKTPG